MIGQTVASRGHFAVQKIFLTGPEMPEREHWYSFSYLLVSHLAKQLRGRGGGGGSLETCRQTVEDMTTSEQQLFGKRSGP